MNSNEEYKILVVEDNTEHLKILFNALNKAHFTVLVAKTGKIAFKRLKHIKPDIILLDIMLPYMDGFEVCRHLKANEETKDIPIIFMTALSNIADKIKGLKLGAVDYMIKPIQANEIVARINIHLNLSRLQNCLTQQNKQLTQEIAERKQLEEHLHKFSSAIEQSANTIVITDLNGSIEFVNPAFSKKTGYSYAEAIGQNPRILNSGEQPSEYYETLWNTIKNGKVWQGELQNKHKNGELYWELATISPIRNSSGKITHYVAIKEDITKRKEIEILFEKQNKELQAKNAKLQNLTQQVAEGQKEKLFQMNKAYERFMPRQFLNLLDKKSILEVNLGDQIEREMTVLFSDIRDFTHLSENMTPQDIFEFVNNYFGQMEPVILGHNGIIDKYIGDAIMALFPKNADDAVCGAIAMLKALNRYNKLLQYAGFKAINIGIGLNTGTLMLGTVGGQTRMDSTVIADAVNLASRVESLTKIYSTPLLITDHTYLKLADPLLYHIRVIDAVNVKGKDEIVTVYEIFDAEPQDELALKDKTSDDFEQGFVLYHCEEYQDALPFFEQVLKTNEKDKVAQIYLERCQNKMQLATSYIPTILIVDDMSANICFLAKFLAGHHFKVLTAKSGKDALRIIQHQNPDLILLDIMMPEMNGFETGQEIKANPKTQDIPIIFMTALGDDESKIQAFELGAVDYITKPFNKEEVLARVKVHLRLKFLEYRLKNS
ncbi:response regulator [Candidatus Parabeggiatoa sp. HSG14]|uniref:response regulator n=1 Tax=Candidatus Parabeggiatoa sp. HSG14 TaxID=3055593 RepID=UPI0025A78618|nr:response regulator [Thiotrichales bacterium HSG14]